MTIPSLFSLDGDSAQALEGIQAELADSSTALPVVDAWHFTGNGPFMALWHLNDFGLTNSGSYHLAIATMRADMRTTGWWGRQTGLFSPKWKSAIPPP